MNFRPGIRDFPSCMPVPQNGLLEIILGSEGIWVITLRTTGDQYDYEVLVSSLYIIINKGITCYSSFRLVVCNCGSRPRDVSMVNLCTTLLVPPSTY